MYPTRARRAGDPAGSPSTSTDPPATRWTPTIERISVDLPLPLGPSSPVTEPCATSQLRPGSTVVPPRTTRRSCTRIAGPVIASGSDGGFGPRDEAQLGHLVQLADLVGELEERQQAGALARAEAV